MILVEELRLAVRRLTKAKLFAASAAAILAVGIGTNTAMYSVVDAFLFRSGAGADADRLVDIYQDDDDGEPGGTSFPAFIDISAASDVFSSASAYFPNHATLTLPDGAEPAIVEYVSASYLPVLGARAVTRPMAGEEEDFKDGAPAAVVSYRTWQKRYGGDPEILGRYVPVSGARIPIVGVGPRDYNGSVPMFTTDYWLSLSSLRSTEGPYTAGTLERRSDHWFRVRARLQPGVTISRAQSRMDSLATRLAEDFPEMNEGRGMTVFRSRDVRIHPRVDRFFAPASAALIVLSSIVLLMICTNLANLLLARGSSRAQEIAIRRALGAPRWALVRLLWGESLVLALVGGVAGVALAHALLDSLMTVKPASVWAPPNFDIGLSPGVLILSLVLSIGTSFLFGLSPAWIHSRPARTMSSAGAGGSLTARGSKLRQALLFFQVVVSVFLLCTASLCVSAFRLTQEVNLGFDTDVAAVKTNAIYAGYSYEESMTAYRAIERELQEHFGRESTARLTNLPASLTGSSTLLIDGYRPESGTEGVEVATAGVGPGYFRTFGVPLMRGRSFDENDDSNAPGVAIVNETMAARYWGRRDVVGEHFRYQSIPNESVEIIGVVADAVVRNVTEPPTPQAYRPFDQLGFPNVYFSATSALGADHSLESLRSLVRRFDEDLPILEAKTMETHVRNVTEFYRWGVWLVTMIGAVGTVLAALGLNAVIAFQVARRVPELGLRMALGASRQEILWLSVKEVAAVGALAVATGIALSWSLSRSLSSQTEVVAPLSAANVLSVCAVIVFVSAMAALAPTRRALRIDPVEALRQE